MINTHGYGQDKKGLDMESFHRIRITQLSQDIEYLKNDVLYLKKQNRMIKEWMNEFLDNSERGNREQ